MRSKISYLSCSLFLLFMCPVSTWVNAQTASKPSIQEVRQLAEDVYIYGYPLVTMEMTRRVMTNVSEPKEPRSPMGRLMSMRSYPAATFRDVTAPNADTLYTTAWIDVGEQPWILSLPDMKDRYYLFPMLDGWTNVFQVPGKRTTGSGPNKYAITGPGWKGKLPEGVTEYKSPTNIVWILGRIYCTGTPEDYQVVHKLQDEISLVPLSAYGKTYSPSLGKVNPDIDMKTGVREQVNAMSIESYFTLLAMLMKDNPPGKADSAMMAKMVQLGIIPGQAYDFKTLDPKVKDALQDVPKSAFKKIMAHFASSGKLENGWLFTTKTGHYGTDYIQRAFITAIGLGANLPEDAVYPTSEKDVKGKPYDGTNKYVIHFNKGEMPPVNGFWSLTMYDADYFFVANPLNRFTLSARNAFQKNPDGSIDLYLQNENPGPEKISNWLPAPAGKFVLMLRLYWPKETPPSILDGTWKIPAVQQIK